MSILTIFLAGFAGLFSHWFKRWARGQTEASFTDYLLTHKRYTAASVVSYFGSAALLISTGVVADVSSMSSIAALFSAGYMADSATNKDADS